jgi:hypothetical protein
MKKYLQLTICSILLLNGMLFSQWSTDPNNTLIVGYGLDPHICSDSAGGCYITYDYDNIYYPRKLGLERLDRYGYKPWGILKQIQGEFPQQYKAQIVEDGEGGVIVSYTDQYEGSPNIIYNVRVQRIDSSGNFLWGQTGVRVTLEGINNSQQKIVSDGHGGAVVEWINHLAEYKINRISSEGQRMWGDSGIVLGTNGYYDPVELIRTTNNKYVANSERNVYRYIDENGNIFCTINVTLGYIIPDDEGGIILSGRVWTGMIPKLVAQRKDSLGNNLWQEPYVEIADSLYTNSPINVKEINRYYYYYWYGTKNGIELVVQYQALRPDGSLLFSEGSQLISNYPVDALIGGMLPSDSGTVVMIWQDYRQDDGVFGQRLDTLGNKLWNSNDVSLYTGTFADLLITSDSNGGAIGLGWHQYDFSLRAFKVSKYGNLGEIVVPVELLSFSGEVIDKKVNLNWTTATETNNRGFEIQRSTIVESKNKVWKEIGFVPGSGTTTDPKSYSFIDHNIETGIYQYRLKQIDFDGSFKYSNVVEVTVNVSLKYSLEQNFPNPFNPTTTIKFSNPKEVQVNLSVYNILGEKVKELKNGVMKPGYFEVQFDASAIASGVYFYRIKEGDFVQTKKMILLK